MHSMLSQQMKKTFNETGIKFKFVSMLDLICMPAWLDNPTIRVVTVQPSS